VANGTDKFTLEVGDDDWPFPFPIVKVGDQWAFDVDAGIDEVVYRRIGRNELGAMKRAAVSSRRRRTTRPTATTVCRPAFTRRNC
jgi:hypothetical protein